MEPTKEETPEERAKYYGPGPNIDNSGSSAHAKELLHEMTRDLLAVYFSKDCTLDQRTMLFDNYVTSIGILLSNDKWDTINADEYLGTAREIADNERLAYRRENKLDNLVIDEPIAFTAEIEQIIGSVAVSDVTAGDIKTDSPVETDESVMRS